MVDDIALRVRWDAPMHEELAFVPGDTLDGHVVLETEEARRCQSLSVALRWRAYGSGDEDTGTTARTELAANLDLEPGAHKFDFSVEAPPGPFTYSGELVFLDWSLRASVTCDDDQTTEDSTFELHPGPSEDFVAGESTPEELTGPPTTAGPGCAFLYLALAGLVGLPTLAFGALMFGTPFLEAKPYYSPSGDGTLVVAGLVGLLLGALVLWSAIRNLLIGRTFPDVDYEVSPRIVERGAELHAAVHLEPPRDLPIEHAEFELRQWDIAREQRTYSKGSSREKSTQRRTVRSQTIELPDAAGRTLPADASVELSSDIPVPDDAAPTFAAEFNEISWELLARITPESAPEWSATMPVVVRTEST